MANEVPPPTLIESPSWPISMLIELPPWPLFIGGPLQGQPVPTRPRPVSWIDHSKVTPHWGNHHESLTVKTTVYDQAWAAFEDSGVTFRVRFWSPSDSGPARCFAECPLIRAWLDQVDDIDSKLGEGAFIGEVKRLYHQAPITEGVGNHG